MAGMTSSTASRHVSHEPGGVASIVEEIRFLHLEADKTRAAASEAGDEQIIAELLQLAEQYDCEARRLNLVDAAERCSSR